MPLTPNQLTAINAITEAINDKLQAIQLARTQLDCLRISGPQQSHTPSIQAVIDANRDNCRAACVALIALLDAV